MASSCPGHAREAARSRESGARRGIPRQRGSRVVEPTLASAAVWPATKTRMPLSPACIQWAMRSIASRARRVDREHAGESLRMARAHQSATIAVSWP